MGELDQVSARFAHHRIIANGSAGIGWTVNQDTARSGLLRDVTDLSARVAFKAEVIQRLPNLARNQNDYELR